MSLDRYNEKRDFKKTPEPAGSVVKNKGALRFVIQKHAATRLHYDFRLELGGVLLSWAVPKGPSLNPADKRLAVHVEDHPLEYATFEGSIPHGEYGGGSVVVWDRGHWFPEGDPENDYKRGNLKFRLDGEKCQGSFALVRMHGPRSDDGKNWLLLKHADEHASEDGELLVRDKPESVQTGRTVEEVAAAPDKAWHSNRGGQKGGEKVLSAAESKSLAIKPKATKKPAVAAEELDPEEVARRRLGLAPRAAARTAKPAKKTAAKKVTRTAAKKATAKKVTKAATAKKATAKKVTKATTTKKAAAKKVTKATTTKKAAAKKTAAKKVAKATGKASAKKAAKRISRAAEEPAPPVRATPPRGRLGESHLPEKIAPELATLVEAVPPGPEWLHEVKYDGYRLVARIDGDHVALLTRGGEDWSAKFPWLVAALKTRVDVAQAILDGELVHLGSDGVTRFGELQKALSEDRHESLVYFVFDVLHLQGLDLRDLPLDQRKQALADLLPPEKKSGRVRLSEHIVGQGEPLITRACKIGLEGVISKRRDAPYKSGRHRDWLKIKCGKRQEVVVGGFTPARSGNRDIGSLLLGLYDEAGNFIYCGKVGSGFDFSGATKLRARLDKLVTRQSPFSKMPPGFSRNTFVRPEIVVEVSFTDWTEDGRMRHPVFEGVREDKPAKTIRRETSMPVAKAVAAVSAPAPATATKAAAKQVLVSKPASSPSKRRGEESEVLGVRVSHPSRVLYPADGITKGEIAEYYAATAGWMMPYTGHRPISVVRCPDNIEKPCFFQKHIHHEMPPGVATADLDGEGGDAPFIYVDTAQGLVGLTQVGTLEVHIWGSTIERPEDPDRIIIDLDPDEKVPWARVKETAAAVRTRLEDLGLTSFLKTTGGKGLHVVAPLTPGKQDWDTVKAFTHGIALEFARAAPDLFTATATKAKRTGRIYIDYLRNYRGSTSVAPYSTRSRPGAPVSVPLRWDELAALESSYKYTIRNLAARLKSLKADPWKDMLKTKQHLKPEVLRAVIKK
ncbi:MAG TPA: DNA ligase D [Nannocystis sp.]